MAASRYSCLRETGLVEVYEEYEWAIELALKGQAANILPGLDVKREMPTTSPILGLRMSPAQQDRLPSR